MADRQVTARLDLKTSGKPDLQALQTAVEGFGDSGAEVAQQVVDGFESVDKAVSKVEGAYARGRVASQKSVGESVVHFENLRQSIIRTFGSLEQAPKEVQDSLEALSGRVDGTRQRFISTTAALRDTNATLNQAGVHFTSLGGAVEQAAGKYAPAVAKIGIFTFALREAYKAFKEVGDATGVNYEPMFKILDDLQAKVKENGTAFNAFMGDVLLAVTNAGGELTNGEITWRAYGKSVEGVIEAVKRLRLELTLAPEQIDVYNVLINKGVSESEALAIVTNNLATAQEVYAEELKKGTAAQRENTDAKKEADPIEKALLKVYGHVTDEMREQVKVNRERIAQAEKERSIKLELTDLEQENLERIAHGLLLRNQLTDVMAMLIERLRDLSPEHEHEADALQKVGTRLAEVAEQTFHLDAATKQKILTFASQVAGFKSLDEAQKQHLESTAKEILSLHEATQAGTGAASATEKVTIAFRDGQTVITNTATATERVAEGFEKVAPAAKVATDETIRITKASGEAFGPTEKLAWGLDTLTAAANASGAALSATRDQLEAIDTLADSVAAKITNLATSLEKVGAAADSASGG